MMEIELGNSYIFDGFKNLAGEFDWNCLETKDIDSILVCSNKRDVKEDSDASCYFFYF